jgi:hypothetical protein
MSATTTSAGITASSARLGMPPPVCLPVAGVEPWRWGVVAGAARAVVAELRGGVVAEPPPGLVVGAGFGVVTAPRAGAVFVCDSVWVPSGK